MERLNLTCAVAWGMVNAQGMSLERVRAELKPYNLYLKKDSGIRPMGHVLPPGWWLYYGSKRGSGWQRHFRGSFEQCCREAVTRINNITPGGNDADI